MRSRRGYDAQGNFGYYDTVYAEFTVLDERTKNMDSLNAAYSGDFPAFYSAMTAALGQFRLERTRTASQKNFVPASRCFPIPT